MIIGVRSGIYEFTNARLYFKDVGPLKILHVFGKPSGSNAFTEGCG